MNLHTRLAAAHRLAMINGNSRIAIGAGLSEKSWTNSYSLSLFAGYWVVWVKGIAWGKV